jgi:hypothetical protein
VRFYAQADVELGGGLDREHPLAAVEVEMGGFGQSNFLKPLFSQGPDEDSVAMLAPFDPIPGIDRTPGAHPGENLFSETDFAAWSCLVEVDAAGIVVLVKEEG